MKQVSLFFLCISLSVFNVAAQKLQTANGTVLLQTVKSREDLAKYSDAYYKTASAANAYFLLSFDHILTSGERSKIEATGLRLTDWLPDNAYIATLDNMDRLPKAFSGLPTGVLPNGIGEVPLALKIATGLYTYVNGAKPLPGNMLVNGLAVSVYQKSDLPLLSVYLDSRKIGWSKQKYTSDNTVVLPEEAGQYIADIAGLGFVESVSPYQGDPTPEWAPKMFDNQVHAVNYNISGAIGRGSYFGNYESYGGDIVFDFNYQGRQHPSYSDNSNNGHGTNCASIVGASNNRDEYEDRGMAPGVTAMYLGWYNAVENRYNNNNIKPLTSNHSVGWGNGQVTYNNDSKELDRITRSLGGYIHCYSAGNSGGSGPYNGYPAGWANLTGNIKVNKNNFTVHSSRQPGVQLDWTNKGPTSDGRLKPDICADGPEGTSYASPGVAGFVNILYEVYTNTYGAFPRSDVVKAVILNTAIDLDKKGIDFKTGFGAINPIRAARSIEQQHIFTDNMPAGSAGSFSYSLNVPAGLREARVLLYWHDYQGTVGAAKALVNDLDLIVLSPSGDTIRPWCLMPTPATVYDLPTRRRDTLNNVEQITIDNPSAGTYTIIINGQVVPQGPQAFAVTYDLLPYQIEITSPVAGFRTDRGRFMVFTWNMANDQANAPDSIQVFLQRTAAEPFSQIASLPNNRLYLEYTIPATFPFSSTARIVVKQKNTLLADTSELFHVMATPANLVITKICNDEITLKWDSLSGNSNGKYIIYRLGNQYMEPIDSIAAPATLHTLSAASILGSGLQWSANEWFAVAARHANGALGLRSRPITQNATNPMSPSPVASSYTLCYGDTATLNIGALDPGDSVRWYKNNTLIPGAAATTLKVDRPNQGVYYFKLYNAAGCTYTSGNYTITAGPANIADTAVWGDYRWNIAAYKGVGYAALPYYGTAPQYYGKFQANETGINSNDYFAWSSNGPHNAPGYTGCSFTNTTNATTVWKRKGFIPGRYRINLGRASGKMNMTVNNGTPAYYTSGTNAYVVNNIWTGYLDTNSTIRIENYGSHLIVNLVPLDSIAPGGISTGLAVWHTPEMSLGADNNKITLINKAVGNKVIDKMPNATITLNPNGRNFNPVLVCNGSGGFQGKLAGNNDVIYNGPAISTFGVFNITSQSTNIWARLFSLWKKEDNAQDYNNDAAIIPFKRNNNTNSIIMFRNQAIRSGTGLTTDKWMMMTSKSIGGNDTVKLNGATAGTGTSSTANFELKQYSIGGYLDNGSNRNIAGNIGEIVHYNRAISGTEEQQVNTYLAIKYGITLPHNYLNTFGQVVYNNIAPYNKNIAGIGSEKRGALLQKQSRSQEPVPDIFTGSLGALATNNTLNNNSFHADTVYAVWGHNGSDIALAVPITNTPHVRMARIWKMEKTGSVGNMRAHFSKSSLPGMGTAGSCDEYYMATSSDPAFPSGNTTFIPLAQYTATDGTDYAYADWDLSAPGNATLYFTVSKKSTEAKALPAGTALSSLSFCLEADSIGIKDPADNKIVARIYKSTGSALPSVTSISYVTNYTDAQLVNCNAGKSISLLNRIMQVDATLPVGATANLRLYLASGDSANAMNNPQIAANSCAPLVPAISWFKEPSTASVFAKLGNMQLPDPYTNIVRGIENGVNYVEFQNLTSFSSFGGMFESSTPLPLRFVDFDGNGGQCNAVLNWKTVGQPGDVVRYVLERSRDGQGFEDVYEIASKDLQFYTATIPQSGDIAYYRLRMDGRDETSTYSAVIRVEQKCDDKAVLIYPNPFRNELTVNGLKTGEMIRVSDLAGRALYWKKATNSSVTLKMTHLASGIYLVQVMDGNGTVIKSEKLVRE